MHLINIWRRSSLFALTALFLSSPASASWNTMQGAAAVGTFNAAANVDQRRLGAIFMCDQVYGLQFIFIPDIIAPPGSSSGAMGTLDVSVDGASPIRLSAQVDLTPDQQRFRLHSSDASVLAAARATASARTTVKVTFTGNGRPVVWQTFDTHGAAHAIPSTLTKCGLH